MRSLCLLITKAPTRRWWGTLTPKGTGGTPKWTGRMGGVEQVESRSGGQTGPEPLRGGWGRRGVLTPGGTLGGSEDQRGTWLASPPPIQALGSLQGSWTGFSTLRGPLWPLCQRKSKGEQGGTLWDWRIGGGMQVAFPPPTWALVSLLSSRAWSSSLWGTLQLRGS